VKDEGFVLIFSPDPGEIALSLGLCALFCAAVALGRRRALS